MNLKDLQRNWDGFGRRDPLWAVISWPEKKGGKWVPEEFFQLGRSEISELLEYLDRLGVSPLRKQALDFGCGVGRLTQALAEHFDAVAGVDIAPSMIKLARQYNRFGDRCRYRVNDRDDLSAFRDDSFDLIVSLICLQHIHPRYSRRYLAEFMRVLAPRGVLYFQLTSRYAGDGQAMVPAGSPGQGTGMAGLARKLVRSATPEPLRNVYRSLRDRNKEPVMEMYGLERSEVERILTDHGGVVLDVVQKPFAPSKWESLWYCATKA